MSPWELSPFGGIPSRNKFNTLAYLMFLKAKMSNFLRFNVFRQKIFGIELFDNL